MRWMLLFFLGACAGGCGHYMHRVVNTGDQMLYAVTVSSDKTSFGHGYLPAGAVKGYAGSMRIVKNPSPIVSWKMSEGDETISRTVELKRSQGRGSETVFEIANDGTVTVRVMPREITGF